MSTTMSRQLAVVTGASSGIGLELARISVKEGYDLVIAADEASIESVATSLSADGAHVTAVQCDLSTLEGVGKLQAAVQKSGRAVDLLFANAGRGLGKAFLDQNVSDAINVVHTNIDGTLYLLHTVGQGHAQPGPGAYSHYRLDRGADAGNVSSRL